MKATRVQVPAMIDGTSVRAFAKNLELAQAAERVVLLEGSDGVFCRGMDLTLPGMRKGRGPELLPELEAFAGCLWKIRTSPMPMIAVVDGETLAGGVGIAAACDLVVATSRSTFGLSEILFGLVPGIVLPLLLERMPAQKARLWALTGMTHEAPEAERAGLVDEVVDPADIEQAVRRWVRRLARADRTAVGDLKRHASEVSALGLGGALRRGVTLTGETLTREAVWIRIRNYLEKGAAPWEAA